jgi:hypothetical protein
MGGLWFEAAYIFEFCEMQSRVKPTEERLLVEKTAGIWRLTTISGLVEPFDVLWRTTWLTRSRQPRAHILTHLVQSSLTKKETCMINFRA